MNLNEAAEIVNKSDRAWLKQNLPYIELRAYVKLVETILAELDPTPITEERLRANGWNLNVLQWVNGDSVIVQVDKGKWMLPGWPIVFHTLGELRTLLRLCGETQGETK